MWVDWNRAADGEDGGDCGGRGSGSGILRYRLAVCEVALQEERR